MNDVEALHRLAFEVGRAASGLPRRASTRLRCVVPPHQAERFRALLSVTTRRIVDVVNDGPPYTWRTVVTDTEARELRRQERAVRAFRRLSLQWFGVQIIPTKRTEKPVQKPEVDPYALLPIDPSTGKPVDLSRLPAPRLPSADLDWLHTEAAAALGEHGTLSSIQGTLERGGTPAGAVDTWPYLEVIHRSVPAATRMRRVMAVWRRLPTWWQDLLTAYYSDSRLAPKLARLRDDRRAWKRANALQSMLDAARRDKAEAWLRVNGYKLPADRLILDAHKLWEWCRRQVHRAWAEGEEVTAC